MSQVINKQSIEQLFDGEKQQLITPYFAQIIADLYLHYSQALSNTTHWPESKKRFETLIDLIAQQIQNPHPFAIFHKAIRAPFDYYQFGLDFIRPFIDFAHSKILGMKNLVSIEAQIANNENVILFANHQIEPDPQTISLLLEKTHPTLAENLIFIAGHRVISDPMAIPMSMGRNLLCIYSKKHIAHPVDEKQIKMLHNQRTMKKMAELLQEGGHCIYVAPSGGRDRPNAQGDVEVAPFDPQSIELLYLTAAQSTKKTHFYPLALRTYDLMPPPGQTGKELGEKRIMAITPVYLAFGEELDMDNSAAQQLALDKRAKRNKRAQYIYDKVNSDYQRLLSIKSA